MDIIGIGVQYKVFDMHDGKVRKIPLTQEESQEVVRNWYGRKNVPAKDLNVNYREITLSTVGRVQALLTRYPALRAHLGNPTFEGGGVYMQDKVQTFGEALLQSPPQKVSALIDAFALLALLCWRYGFSDQVFNCTINNGVDKNGRVVLLDFNEVTFDKERAEEAVAEKRWLRSYSFLYDLDDYPEAKVCFRDCLGQKLTIESLNANWGSLLVI